VRAPKVGDECGNEKEKGNEWKSQKEETAKSETKEEAPTQESQVNAALDTV
jgi:hypothetical protein